MSLRARKFWSKVKTVTWVVVGGACVVHALSEHVAVLAKCEGDSMYPTLLNGDLILIDRLTFRWFRRPTINDVVVLRKPNNPLQVVVKRVTGCNNGTVEPMKLPSEVDNDSDSDYAPSSSSRVSPKWLSKSHLWVSGDNSGAAIDSRHYGAVPERLVIGLVAFRLWPFSRAGGIPTSKASSSA